MGRPKIYATPAERIAAYREKHARVDLNLDRSTFDTLEKISAITGRDVSTVCRSLLKFALTNRDWQKMGLTHDKK